MRFLLAGGKERGAVRPLVLGFLVFIALFLVGLAAQRAAQGLLSPAGIEAYYVGGVEPDAGAGTRLWQPFLWEELHVSSFLYGFLLLVLGSLLVASPLAPRARGRLLWAATMAALADLASPFVIALAGGLGALKLATFVVTLAALGGVMAVVAARFGRTASNGPA